jgi:hypothetical protein
MVKVYVVYIAIVDLYIDTHHVPIPKILSNRRCVIDG